jgi:hypothetical protein
MEGKDKKDVPTEMAEMQAKLDAMKAERDAAIKESANLRTIVKDDTVGKVIKGEVALSLKDTEGAVRNVKVGFKSGRVKVHVIDIERGWNETVSSEALLSHANGTATDTEKSANPLLAVMPSSAAKAYVEHLAKIQYEGLEVTDVA